MDISKLLRFMHGLGVWLLMQRCPVVIQRHALYVPVCM